MGEDELASVWDVYLYGYYIFYRKKVKMSIKRKQPVGAGSYFVGFAVMRDVSLVTVHASLHQNPMSLLNLPLRAPTIVEA